MKFLRLGRRDERAHPRNHPAARRIKSRSPRIEPLEDRCLLAAAPTLAPIPDVTVNGGEPLHIALDGFDGDGDALSYTATVEGYDGLTTLIPQGNRSARFTVSQGGDTPIDGEMILELFEQRVPNTTGRIIELAQSGFYDGTIFHRVINSFMIQGGDPLGNGTGGSGFNFPDEFHSDLLHTSSGVWSMANSGPDTNDSQFFITAVPTPWLDGKHAVFGFLTEGDDVRQSIETTPTDVNDRPLDEVVLTSMEIFEDTENAVLMLAAPLQGYVGTAQVTVTATDESGLQAVQTFEVDVIPSSEPPDNNPPTLAAIDDVTMQAGGSHELALSASDPDGDPLQYKATVEGGGNLSVSVVGTTLKLFAAEGPAGEGNVTVTVSDDKGGEAEQSFTVTVESDVDPSDNVAPVLEPIPDVTVQVGVPLHVALQASDEDNDLLTFSASVADHDTLTATYEDGGLMLSAPEGSASGQAGVTVVVSDGHGHTAEQTFTADVAAEVTLEPIQDVILPSGVPLYIPLSAFDRNGDPLSFSATSDVADQGLLTTEVSEGNRSLQLSVTYGGVDNLSWDTPFSGTMTFELFEQRAPKTTARIIELVESAFYSGLTFSRVTGEFIQGGDPEPDISRQWLENRDPSDPNTETLRETYYETCDGSGVLFDDEFHPELQHTSAGMLTTAGFGLPATPNDILATIRDKDDTNDSQFLITAGPARALDFNHSVFGLLTDGDDIRRKIAGVPTVEDVPDFRYDRPQSDVVITSASIIEDNDSAVLMLAVPDTITSGSANVTVTVTDGGHTAQQTFRVTVQPDIFDSKPFLEAIEDIHTTVDTPVTVNLPAIDVEGNFIYYEGMASPINGDLAVDIDAWTGETTITPRNGLHGVLGIFVGVRDEGGSFTANQLYSDVQEVPVIIHPFAPTSVELLSGSDTGSSNSDLLTRLDNTPGKTLQFRVRGATPGIAVKVLADGVTIGQAVATSNSVIVTTDGATALDNGLHTITAVQSFGEYELNRGARNEMVDVDSDPTPSIKISVKGSAPEFLSAPVVEAAENRLYAYDVETDDEWWGGALTYSFATSPDGMTIDKTTGQILWTPRPDQRPTQAVVVRATDSAGNVAEHAFDVAISVGPHVDQWVLPAEAIADGHKQAFITTLSGRLTVEALFSHAAGDVDLILVTDAGVEVGRSSTGNDNERIDVTVATDEIYRFVVSGDNPAVSFRVTNLLEEDGSQVTVWGTEYNDDFEVTAGSTHRVVVNGTSYDFDSTLVDDIIVDGLDGFNQVVVTGSAADETVTLWPFEGEVVGPDYRIDLYTFESVTVDGGGGYDEAHLHDTADDDQFVGTPVAGIMSNEDFENIVKNFDSVEAHSTGGIDVARLYDSPQNDTYRATPEEASLSGPDFDNRAVGFAGVHAFSTAGGSDVAECYDSSGDDTFLAGSVEGALYGDGFYNRAKFFDNCQAFASDGYDVAELYDSPGNDTFYAEPGSGSMNGAGYVVGAEAFEVLRGLAYAGGNDVARIVDSQGDDNLYGSPGSLTMYAGGFASSAENFEQTTVSTYPSGTDVARLSDSPGDDTFVAEPGHAEIYNSQYSVILEEFSAVHVFATAGGNDKAELYDTTMGDMFYAKPHEAGLFGDGFYNHPVFFEEVIAKSYGGDDVAEFYDSPDNDGTDNFLFDGTDMSASMYGAVQVAERSGPYNNRAESFPHVYAYGSTEGLDAATFRDSPGNDNLVVAPNYGLMHSDYGNGFSAEAHDFRVIAGFSDAGGVDVARLYDSPKDDFVLCQPTVVSMHPSDGKYLHNVENFEGVHVYATAGGNDQANMSGTAQSDAFYASSTEAALWGDGFYNRVRFFEEVYADAGEGDDDRADLFDSPASDLLEAENNWARMSNKAVDFLFEATGFDHVTATTNEAGNQKNVAGSLEFDLDLIGPW